MPPKCECELGPREREVLQMVADGGEYLRIAESLNLSPRYIKTMMYLVLAKLGADNKTQAVAMALRKGLIQ